MPLLNWRKPKHYFYEDAETFQLALLYFNRRWERNVDRNETKQREEEQDIYDERRCILNTKQNVTCTKCKQTIDSGHKYFVNKRNSDDVLCLGCMGRKLKKNVGCIKTRLEDELRWLDNIQPYSQQYSTQFIMTKY